MTITLSLLEDYFQVVHMQWLGNGYKTLFDTKTPWQLLSVAGDAGGGWDLAALGHSWQEGGEKLC